MADLKLVIRTADRSRKAEITVADVQTGSEVIQASVDNWALPKDTEYTLVNVTKDPPQTLDPAQNLAKAGVAEGDTLEIQPVLVAGV
ncbi:MAG TPA: hypothetical protein PLF03_07530 [Candidatus Omnitrophota bacterium]|nr:hypothetical protein [Candidatus Omnitrophota bacterium]